MTLKTVSGERISFKGPLWRWTSASAPAAWFFITIGGAAGEALAATALMRRLELGTARGFGAIKVTARIGEVCWNTSVFPAKQAGEYMLPVKLAVRRAEGLDEGDVMEVELAF